MPKVLVIDDDPDLSALLVELLRQQGYEVEARRDGAAGVEAAKAHRPDIVLCDIMMPRMDGYAVLSALRQDPATATLPFIFLTGVAGPEAQRKGMELGADDYLDKPMNSADLVRAVEARLARHAVARREIEQRIDQLRADLTRSLPHEFLTPLTAVIGLSTLLMEGGDAVEAAAVPDIARGIFAAGRRLQQLIEKFLLHAELEDAARDAGHVAPAELQVEDVGAVVEPAARALAAAMGRAADVSVQGVAAALPVVRDHLRALVRELVENALQYSAAGSPTSVVCSVDGSRCEIAVTDAGRGMSPAQVKSLDRLWASARRHDEQPGMGLGLSIARRVTLLYGGALEIDSAPGRGTTVRVSLARQS